METSSDSQTLLQPVVGPQLRRVGYVHTIWAAFCMIAIMILMGASVISAPFLWSPIDGRECEIYFYVLYLQTAYWVLAYLFDVYFRRKHTDSRIEGFLEFYEEVSKYSKAPFVIVSTCTALLLGLASFFHHHYRVLSGYCRGNLSDPLLSISIFVFLEVVSVKVILIIYAVKVHRFNLMKAPPDALRDEWMATFIRDSYSGGEIGYRERDNHVDDLLERQASLLRYLKDQNARLVQKVLTMSLQLQENIPIIS